MVYFVSLTLLFVVNSATLANASKEKKLELLKLVKGYGKDLQTTNNRNKIKQQYSRVKKFIKENPETLTTPLGIELRLRQNRLNSFIKVQNYFDKCLGELRQKTGRNLDERILNSLLNSSRNE